MAGGNGNSRIDELFKDVEGVVDNTDDYKKFEKVLSKDDGKEEFVQQVDSKGDQILQSFGNGLDDKIQAARADYDPSNPEKKGTMKKNVREAYMVLGKLRDKAPTAPTARPAAAPTDASAEQPADQTAQRVPEGNGRAGLYNEMKDAAEQEVTLDKKYQEIIKMIDNNPEWSAGSKETAKKVIKELFEDCNSVEEFERRTGTRLGMINNIDNVKDVIKGGINFVKEIPGVTKKALFELYRLCGVAMEKLNQMWNEALKAGKAVIKDFVEWCKEAGQKISDITKTILQFGGDLFKKFLNYLEGIGEGIKEALNTAWEFCGKQWDKFVNLCGGIKDVIVAFGKDLVEKGKLAWKTFLDSMKNAWDKVKDICTDLINKGKIKFGEFVEWCNGLAQKGKELLVGIIESSVAMWNKFADWCKDNWESAKNMFKEIARTLLEKGKMALDTFLNWCKGAWETVKDVACAILVGLVKAGKFALDVVCSALLVVVGSVVLLGELLIKAGKEIYKGGKLLANFISKLALNLWEKGKEAFATIGALVGKLLNKCKELGIATIEFVQNFLKSAWKELKEFGLTVKDLVVSTYEAVKGMLKSAWDATAEFFINLGLGIKDVVSTLYEAAKGAWKNCADFIVNAIEKFKLKFKDAMSFLANKLRMGLDAIGSMIVKGGKYVAEFINYVKEKGKMTLENIKKWCEGKAEAIRNLIKTAIEKCNATWNDITEWCKGKIDDIKQYLFDIYGKTKEGVKKLITLVGKGIEEGARYLMKIGLAATEVVVGALVLLGIGVAKITELMAEGLKYAYHTVEAVAKKLVEVMQKAGKFVAKAVCDAIFECYGRGKELVTRIGKAVAEAVRDIATTVRDWIYEKTNDMKKAVESMKKWLSKSIGDVYKWMKAKGANAINAIKVIGEVFVDSIGTAIKALYEAGASVIDLVTALGKKVYDYIF